MKTGAIGVGLILMAVVGGWTPAVPGQAGAESGAGRIENGKKVYGKYCAGCHGTEGKGDGYKILGADPANFTVPLTKKKSDTALLKTIHEGKPTMPSWKARLSDQDSRDVLAYIRTLAK
jgi:mono/diheme cytochrome c family protein